MTFASRTQFHVERPWGQEILSTVFILSFIFVSRPSTSASSQDLTRGTRHCSRVNDFLIFASSSLYRLPNVSTLLRNTQLWLALLSAADIGQIVQTFQPIHIMNFWHMNDEIYGRWRDCVSNFTCSISMHLTRDKTGRNDRHWVLLVLITASLVMMKK